MAPAVGKAGGLMIGWRPGDFEFGGMKPHVRVGSSLPGSVSRHVRKVSGRDRGKVTLVLFVRYVPQYSHVGLLHASIKAAAEK